MNELQFIETFLRENRDYVRDKYAAKCDLIVTSKLDANDLLTEVDLTIQKRIVEEIRKRFPGDAILADENGVLVLKPSDIAEAAARAVGMQNEEKAVLKRVAAGEKMPDINGTNARIAEMMRAAKG